VFSPFLLAVKIFLLMGLTCVAIFLAFLAIFRRQPLGLTVASTETL